MSTVQDLSSAIMILINVGLVLRILLLVFSTIHNPDEMQLNKKRIFNALKFLVITSLVFALKDLILNYF